MENYTKHLAEQILKITTSRNNIYIGAFSQTDLIAWFLKQICTQRPELIWIKRRNNGLQHLVKYMLFVHFLGKVGGLTTTLTIVLQTKTKECSASARNTNVHRTLLKISDFYCMHSNKLTLKVQNSLAMDRKKQRIKTLGTYKCRLSPHCYGKVGWVDNTSSTIFSQTKINFEKSCMFSKHFD